MKNEQLKKSKQFLLNPESFIDMGVNLNGLVRMIFNKQISIFMCESRCLELVFLPVWCRLREL